MSASVRESAAFYGFAGLGSSPNCPAASEDSAKKRDSRYDVQLKEQPD
jgi:hypothetical protein